MRLSTWYDNLPIRDKLILGFGILIALLVLVIISNSVIETALSDPANRRLTDAGENVLLATQIGFEFERGLYEERIFETFYIESGFDRTRLADAYGVVQEHMVVALNLLDTAVERSRTGDEVARVETLRDSLETYNTNITVVVDDLLPQRGTTSTGFGGEIYLPLEAVNTSVDASHAMGLVENYIFAFDPGAIFTLPNALNDLKQSINNADLSAEQKEALIAQADASQNAFLRLVAFDAEILQRYTEITQATEALATQLGEYIASQEQQQRDAQTRLDRAGQIRTMVSWGVAILAVLFALALARTISRSVSLPVMALNDVAHRVAEGDYTQRAAVTTTDEVGQLSQAFNDTIAKISEREAQLREQTEKLRIATARAKEAARLKSEFLANMSHELRTPLNAIIGFSDMLLMGIGGELVDKQRHKVDRLRENGTRLLNLVNNILDLTRIEAKRIEIVHKPFAPKTLVERLTKQMEPLAEKKQLAFQTYLDPDLPDTLIGDEPRLEQIVVNLLSNAFKFTDKGSVTLAVRINRAAQQWSVSVTDTGIGIPLHSHEVIFEEFRQLDGSSSRAYQGSGLGLAITGSLVRMMDGYIDLKSEVGNGSTFTVTLPLIESAASAEAVPSPVGLPEGVGLE